MNPDKERILEDIREIFVESFELKAESVTLEARLYEDLDIDSIDAVDLIVALKRRVGKKITPEAFKKVRTVGDIVEAVSVLLEK